MLELKKKKGYEKIRLGELKKLSRNFESAWKRSHGYEDRIQADMPILLGHHRGDPWVIWLHGKITNFIVKER